VEVTPFVSVRVVRAVRGVGALICDFFGVSVTLETRELERLDDDSKAFAVAGEGLVTLPRRPALRKACCRAPWGFIRRSGSQTKQRAMKSTKSSSWHRRTCARDLVPGLLLRPLEFTTGLGAPLLSKKSRLRELRLMKSLSGGPRTSMIQDNCSCSFSPGKMGKPVYSSARMQPKLHMSMAM